MKKAIRIISIIMLLVLVSSCAAKTEDLSNYNIEDLSKYNLEYIPIDDLNYMSYHTLEQMYEMVDYVVIASPVDTLENSVQHWRGWDNKPTENFDDTSYVFSFTERKCKVHKVLKGENKNLKEITLCENFVKDGNNIKITNGEYIAKANNKYLLFLSESTVIKGFYFPTYYQGKYDLNAEENAKNKQIDQKLFKEVKQAYKDQVK